MHFFLCILLYLHFVYLINSLHLCLSLGECITASFLHTEPSLEISTMTQGSWAQSVVSSVLFLISSLINLSHPLLSTHSIDPTNHFSPPSLVCRKGPEIFRPELPSTQVSPYLIASRNSTLNSALLNTVD